MRRSKMRRMRMKKIRGRTRKELLIIRAIPLIIRRGAKRRESIKTNKEKWPIYQ
jgi:hypothetical protein